MMLEISIYRPSNIGVDRIRRSLEENDEFLLADNLQANIRADLGGLTLEDEDSILYIYRNCVECIEFVTLSKDCVFLVGQSPPSVIFSKVSDSEYAIKVGSYGKISEIKTIDKSAILENLERIKLIIEEFVNSLQGNICAGVYKKLYKVT